jgi:hypothetical protein
MHSRPAVRILLASSLCAACGPVVATGDEGSTGAAESSSTSGSSTIDPGSGSTGSSESGAAQTSDSGDPPPDDVPGVDPEPCPDSQWPDDGSEVLEHVTESAVVDWTETGFSALYSTYLSDDSPVPGQQTLGLSGNPPDATAYNFGATIDMMSAVELRGRRIRMRAPVALSSVEVRANLWLRIDVTTGESANLDNGSDQPAYGTSEAWQSQEIVVDVPDDAETIVFGSLLSGPGTILVSNPVFDIVSEDVPTTAPNRRRPDVALSCAAPTDAYVEEIVHYTRADQWGPSNGPAAEQEFGRDDDVTYDGVPSLHVSGEPSSSYAARRGVDCRRPRPLHRSLEGSAEPPGWRKSRRSGCRWAMMPRCSLHRRQGRRVDPVGTPIRGSATDGAGGTGGRGRLTSASARRSRHCRAG